MAKAAGVNPEDATSLIHLNASVASSMVCMTIVNPLWVIRTRIMTQSTLPSHKTPYNYKSTYDAFRSIVRDEGWTALYKGFGPSLLGISHVAVQFPLYEKMKTWLKAYERKKNPNAQDLSASDIFVASSVSKIMASTITYPHEVLRTRLQTQPNITHIPHNFPPDSPEALAHEAAIPRPKYRGIVHAVKVIVKEEGWRAFYKGLSTNLIRTVPASAISLWTYEVLVQELARSAGQDGKG
ncbi:hypothetical protein HK104_008605 [Borealophlyctis nickersoniae]|nr:hypothetical protein HK104_008605 [Borealophlyctis nickersoniae]